MSDAGTPDQGCRNLRWALALFDGLVQGGLRRVVLSPGSRSTPLVLAARRQHRIELTPVLDERSAGFFALGAARASGRPVALVCTSGSALSHWFPAVIEASESGLPLILLSADRPPELRGWGANQTIDQTRLFGTFVREFHDPGPAEEDPAALKAIRALGLRAALVSRGPRPGPVHLNLPFREPLVPRPSCVARALDDPADTAAEPAPDVAVPPRTEGPPIVDHAGDNPVPASRFAGQGIICCGPMGASNDALRALAACAERLDAPILADPLSGLRFGPAPRLRVVRYDSLLRNPAAAAALRPDWVIRFGGTPVSKTLADWLAGIPAILVDAAERWTDPNHDLVARIGADPIAFLRRLQAGGIGDSPAGGARRAWIARWTRVERTLDRLAEGFLEQAAWCEAHLIRTLLERLPAHDGLFCANSLPIRQLDTWSGSSAKPLRVFGQRGASGIDGQTSTLAGLNAGSHPGPSGDPAPVGHGVTGLLGDLAFLHDPGGLALMERLDRPCIVLNNGGGRIFDELPQRDLPDLEWLWRTPQRVRLGALTHAFGLPHRTVDDAAGFRQALDEALTEGARQRPAGVIEVRIDAASSRETHRAFRELVREQPLIEIE